MSRASDRATEQAAADTARVAAIVELHVQLSEVLGSLSADAELIDELTEAHQSGRGFMTHAAREAAGLQWAKDRRDRALSDAMGQAHGSGPVATPGAWSGIAGSVELWHVLADQIRRIHRAMNSYGVCSLHRVPDGASNVALTGVLRRLVMDLSHPVFLRLLQDVLTELLAAREATSTLIDGSNHTSLGNPCPWCKNRSLVVYFEDDLVRCDRDPSNGRYPACVCSDPLCACKVDPVAHRHQWLRAKGKAVDGWYTLALLLNPGVSVADRLSLSRVINQRSTQ